MTQDEIRAHVEKAIELEDFESPISIAYCEALRKRVVKLLGKAASVEVYHRNDVMFVRAERDQQIVLVITPLV